MRKPNPDPRFAMSEPAAVERLRQSVAQVTRTQRSAPAGWAMVVVLAWQRVPLSLVAWCALGFGIAGVGVLLGLRHIRRSNMGVARGEAWLKSMALIDGLAWGAMPWALMGRDTLLDSWLVTLLCGVAAVNAVARAMVIQAFGLQLLGIWVPTAAFCLAHFQMTGMPQILAGLTVFFAVLYGYMHQVSTMINQNIQLRLDNEAMSAALRQSLTESERQAATDPLTGQANRRTFEQALSQQHAACGEPGVGYALLMLDIDHFKSVNDRFGHQVGDLALKAFAARVALQLRERDLLARVGGEEFIVLLRGADHAVAAMVAQRVCAGVAAQPLLLQPLLPVTVSVGVAVHQPGVAADELVQAADRAVYQAKHLGRNQVQFVAVGHAGEEGAAAEAPRTRTPVALPA